MEAKTKIAMDDKEIRKLFCNLRTTFQSQVTTENKLEAVKFLVNRWIEYKANEGYKTGIKEAVEEAESDVPCIKDTVRWQAKKKDWVISKEIL